MKFQFDFLFCLLDVTLCPGLLGFNVLISCLIPVSSMFFKDWEKKKCTYSLLKLAENSATGGVQSQLSSCVFCPL